MVVARVDARSKDEAFDLAITAIDEVRGLMNFALNRRTGFRWSSGQRQPVNSLRLGPMHTLHDLTSALATEFFLYEPEFIEPTTLANLDKERDQLRVFLHDARKRSLSSGLYDSACEGIVRYTRALDRRDWRVSFQELWTTLEYLTVTMRASYDVTVRRAAAMYRDHDLMMEIVKHLRDVRNEIVHATAEQPGMESLMYQLKGIVEVLLGLYLSNSHNLRSRDEVAEFLDTPKDLPRLKRKRQIINAALAFRSQ